MEVTGVNEDQVSCPGSKIVFIDAKTGRSGTQVDQLDLLVPVGQEADIGIGTLSYHEIRPVIPDFVKCFHMNSFPWDKGWQSSHRFCYDTV